MTACEISNTSSVAAYVNARIRKISNGLQGIIHNMKKILGFWKVIVLDTLGVAVMIAAILTGWLPGPGGVPLFILGLSLLAINHEWAKRYIHKIQDYIKKLSDQVFSDDPYQQLGYDIICPLMIAGGGFLLWRYSAPWLVSVGIFLVFTGIVTILGNRGRWQRFKKWFKRQTAR